MLSRSPVLSVCAVVHGNSSFDARCQCYCRCCCAQLQLSTVQVKQAVAVTVVAVVKHERKATLLTVWSDINSCSSTVIRVCTQL
jgi:hypothetical protein